MSTTNIRRVMPLDISIHYLVFLRLDTRMISFKTYDFGTFALLADRHAHMPFQSWRMRPKSPDSVLFSLTTPSFEIMFEIRVSSIVFCLYEKKISIYINSFLLFLEKKRKTKYKIKKSYTQAFDNRIA